MSELPFYVRDTSKWKMWHEWADTAEDTLTTSLAPSARPVTRILDCGEVSAVMIRAWGAMAADASADNKTATVQIIGWKENGPGQLLWKGTLTFGAHTFTESLDGISAPSAWYDADTWTDTSNAVSATSYGITDQQSLFVIPVVGYHRLSIESTDKDGSTGTEVGKMSVMWVPYSALITI